MPRRDGARFWPLVAHSVYRPKGKKRPRGWHHKHGSPEMKKAVRSLGLTS